MAGQAPEWGSTFLSEGKHLYKMPRSYFTDAKRRRSALLQPFTFAVKVFCSFFISVPDHQL